MGSEPLQHNTQEHIPSMSPFMESLNNLGTEKRAEVTQNLTSYFQDSQRYLLLSRQRARVQILETYGKTNELTLPQRNFIAGKQQLEQQSAQLLEAIGNRMDYFWKEGWIQTQIRSLLTPEQSSEITADVLAPILDSFALQAEQLSPTITLEKVQEEEKEAEETQPKLTRKQELLSELLTVYAERYVLQHTGHSIPSIGVDRTIHAIHNNLLGERNALTYAQQALLTTDAGGVEERLIDLDESLLAEATIDALNRSAYPELTVEEGSVSEFYNLLRTYVLLHEYQNKRATAEYFRSILSNSIRTTFLRNTPVLALMSEYNQAVHEAKSQAKAAWENLVTRARYTIGERLGFNLQQEKIRVSPGANEQGEIPEAQYREAGVTEVTTKAQTSSREPVSPITISAGVSGERGNQQGRPISEKAVMVYGTARGVGSLRSGETRGKGSPLRNIWADLPQMSGEDYQLFERDTMNLFTLLGRGASNNEIIAQVINIANQGWLQRDTRQDVFARVFERFGRGSNTAVYKRTSNSFLSGSNPGSVYGHEVFSTGFNEVTGEQQSVLMFEIRRSDGRKWVGVGIMPDVHNPQSAQESRNNFVALSFNNEQELLQELRDNPEQAIALSKISRLDDRYLVIQDNQVVGVTEQALTFLASGLYSMALEQDPGGIFAHLYTDTKHVQGERPTAENIREDFTKRNPNRLPPGHSRGLIVRDDTGQIHPSLFFRTSHNHTS